MGLHSLRVRSRRRRVALAAATISTMCIVGMVGAVASQAAAPTSAADDFSRTVAVGLGSADVGGTYTLAYPGTRNPYSVSSGAAQVRSMVPGTSVTASLMQPSIADGVVESTINLTSVGESSVGLYHAVEARRQSDGSAYRGRVSIGASGKLAVSFSRTKAKVETLLAVKTLSASVGPGQSLDVQFRFAGTSPVTLAVRSWIEGQAVPDWQLTYSDSSAARISRPGGVGTWDYLSSASAALDLAISSFGASTTGAGGPTPTSAPSTSTAAPTSSSTPPPAAPSDPTSSVSVGSIAVGSARYSVPSNALYVSAASGSDAQAGSSSQPLRTLAAAIKKASTGQTIVLRAGSYHETVTVNKQVVVQNYPGEAVWFEGSSLLTDLKKDGPRWSQSNWTTKFDSSPTYTRGGPASTAPSWGFVNAAHPMAAHPDQVWVDGSAQAQVGSLGEVTSGKFFVDYGASKLYLGSDPTGHTVRASDLVTAMTVSAPGAVIRGIGVRRYAPSIPDMGAVRVSGNSSSLENVILSDNATTGLSLLTSNISLNQITSVRNGMMGIHANYADNMKINSLNASGNNTELFNVAPVSGGMKVTRSRNVTVTGSMFNGNNGPGLWFDESSYNLTIAGNIMADNTKYGMSLEISSDIKVLNNLVMKNIDNGIAVKNAGSVQIWNNTILNNARPISITQDTRLASNLSTPGHDPRQKLPDPSVNWLTGPDRVSNNVISGSTGNCLLCVEDWTHTRSAAQMGITASGNAYQRMSTAAPSALALWPRQGTDPAVFKTLDAFKSATGQDSTSIELPVGSSAASSNGVPSASLQASAPSVAIGLPSDVAALMGKSAGMKHLGSWLSVS